VAEFHTSFEKGEAREERSEVREQRTEGRCGGFGEKIRD
jgi:hypothetical protein